MLRKPHQIRVFLLSFAITAASVTVMARLAYLQVAKFDSYTDKAKRLHHSKIMLQPERGAIMDRKGTLLANSTRALSFFINPSVVREKELPISQQEFARQIALYSNFTAEEIQEKLAGTRVTAVGKQLPPESAQKIADLFDELNISSRGYWFDQESKRHYLTGSAPHILGFTGKDEYGDNKGLAGLELTYSEHISGSMVEARIARSGMAQIMEPVGEDKLIASRGDTLITTIDINIQQEAEKALERAVTEYNANAAGAVVMDVQTGAILAMASWPTYDNNKAGLFPGENLRNRILTDPLETGSVVKLFTAAIVLDQGHMNIDTLVDCGGGSAYFGRRRVQDAPGHHQGVVPFYMAMRYSSNVGIINAAQSLDNQVWYDYLRGFTLGEKTGIDLPGEGNGILYPPSKWTSLSRSSLPMGYELALTPMQIVVGIGALVNGGKILEPYVVEERHSPNGEVAWKREPVVRRQVISTRTSMLMRELMEDVVLNGTGKSAQIPGFRVGGKTGTTRKSNVFTHREYIASFGGALPIDQPRVAIYCYVDNPTGKYYGGSVAAPIFQSIAQECVLQLGLIPSEVVELPKERIKAAEEAAEAAMLPAGEQPLLRFALGQSPETKNVPDFTGLSMLEVRHVLEESDLRVRFEGSGLVVSQSPAAGELLDPQGELKLVFSQTPVLNTAATELAAESGTP